MTKIKNTKKGMAKKTLSMSLVVAMLATSNVPVWAAEFSDGTDATAFTSEAEAPVVDDTTDAIVDNAQDAVATISVVGATDNKISVNAANKSMTINTNWEVNTNKKAYINLYAPKNENASEISKGMTNKQAMDAGYDEFYSDAYSANTLLNGKKVGGSKSIDFSKYIGKKLYVTISEADASITHVEATDCNIELAVAITITGNTNQDYVEKTFNKTVGWGTTLGSLAGYSVGGGATVASTKWYDPSGNEVAGTYETTKDDINKTYTLKAKLNGALDNTTEVILGTVTIKEADATAKILKVEWDCDTDTNGNPTFTYDGNEHRPHIKKIFLDNGITIDADDTSKVTIKYPTDIEPDNYVNVTSGISYPVEVKTKDYNFTYTKNFIIKTADLSKVADLEVKEFEFNPTGLYTIATPDDELKAGLSVTTKTGKKLELGTDYNVAVTYSSKNEVGTDTAFVKITGINNYADSFLTKKAAIVPHTLKDGELSLDHYTFPYNGRERKPTVTVTVNGVKLTEKTDYTIDYKDNKEVGKATVTVTGTGNYAGSAIAKFDITSAELGDLRDKILNESINGKKFTYTGKAITPVEDAYGTNLEYVKGRDFNVEYLPQNVNAGKVRIKLTGLGNYKDAKVIDDETLSFTIAARSLNDKDVKVEMKGLTYSKDMTDAQIENAVTVTYNGMTLVKDTDYAISVDQTTLAATGKVKIKITGKNGNYKDERTEYLAVTAKDISNVTLPKVEAQKYSDYAFVVDGTELKTNSKKVADFVLMDGSNKLVPGTDYEIAGYENNKNVGTATINIVGKGGYAGKVSVSFPIVEKELNGTIMFLADSGKPTALLPDKEYNYKDATSSKGYVFDLASKLTDKGELAVIDETGSIVDPSKYTVTYKDNKATGTATITVEGKGAYKLSAVNTFRIVPAKLYNKDRTDKEFVTALDLKDNSAKHYTGEEIKPEVTITAKDGDYTLVEGTDYKLEYSDNINAGKAKIKVVGLGNYAGTVDLDENSLKNHNLLYDFTINKADIVLTDIAAADVPYAGGITVSPAITIKNRYSNKALVEGTDYTVEVTKGGANVGQAEAKIKLTSAAANNYSLVGGTEYTVRFNVASLDLSKATVSPIADQTATGEQIKPAITVMNGSVKLVEGKDYEVSYGENKEVGEGTVTIKALSSNKNYTGSQTVKFNIVKETPAVGQAMISEVRVSGNTVTPVLSGDVDGAVGYDYVIATEEDTQNGRVDISKNVLKTNTNFYYVQEGTYYAYCHAWTRDENGKKVFGEWSNIKKFTVDATTPSKPSIKSVKVKGHTVTVTFTASEDAKGYDVVLGEAVKKVNGENRPVEYGKLVVKNIEDGVYTATFYNVPDGKYYAGVHSYNKSSNDGKKVFSKWGYRKTAISVGKAN